jgi:hypothetical protein
MPDQTFTSGQILTAAQMSALQANSGLVFIKSQALSGTSNLITGAFSSSFDNYKIMLSGSSTMSATTNIALKMGTTAANYYSTRFKNSPNSSAVTGNGLDNISDWSYAGQGSTTYANLNIELMAPFLTKYTRFSGTYLLDLGSASEFGYTQGHLADTTSYTSFTLATGGATFSGTVYVYGYRNP